MKAAPFIALLVAGGLFGWFAPDLVEEPAAPVAAEAEGSAKAAAHLDVAQRDQWLAGEVALPRRADGHFYADVTIEGAALQMLVDTGASTIALTGEDAEAMGISWNDDEVRPVAEGASGPVYGVRVTLGHVQLGEFEARGVEATVIPEGLGISLLGQSFLSTIPKVEMEGDRMVLGG